MQRYVLANDKGCYIGQDESSLKYKIVRDIDQALRWKTEQSANNLWLSSLSKNKIFSSEFYFPLVVYEAETVGEEDLNALEEEAKNLEKTKSKYKTDTPFDLEEIEKWRKTAQNSMKLIMNILSTEENVKKQLADVEAEIVDIRHYIEFNKLPANQGYQAYKMLRERLLIRRALKDTISIFQYFEENKIKYAQLENISTSIDNLDNREYAPRRLTELFEPKVKDMPTAETTQSKSDSAE